MMFCGSNGPPFKVASAWGEAAHVLEGFKIPGRKLAADTVTSPALIKSRREIPLLFIAEDYLLPASQFNRWRSYQKHFNGPKAEGI
jgi:hypothetical protein